MSIETDFSDCGRLAAQLSGLPAGSEKTLRQAVQVTAHRVKDGWNGKLYRDGHAARTAGAIDYDTTVGADGISAEIGAQPGRGRQAGVVRLLENGSIHNGAHGYGAAALHEQEGDLVAGVERAIADAVRQAGL